MSSDGLEDRLDAMLAPLRDHPATLDEVTRARVASRLQAARDKVDAPSGPASRRRWRGAGAAAMLGVAATAAVVFALAVVGRGERGRGAPPPSGGASVTTLVPDATTAGPWAAPILGGRTSSPVERAAGTAPAATEEATSARLGSVPGHPRPDRSTAGPSGATGSAGPAGHPGAPEAVSAPLLTVVAGDSAQVSLDGSLVTIVGPGQLSQTRDGAVVEAAGIVVDRTRGDKPLSVRYQGVEIVATHATFAAYAGTGVRVTVMRGDITLRCPSGARTIRAGAATTCDPARKPGPARATRPKTPPLETAAPEQAQATEAPLPAPSPDLYSLADDALRRGDHDAALVALLAVVESSPDSLEAATALLDLARLAMRRGDTRAALSYLDRLDRHPQRAALAVLAYHLRAILGEPAPGTPAERPR